MPNNLTDIAGSLKILLEENDGEVGYWGAKIPSRLPIAVPPAPRTSKKDLLDSLFRDTIGDCQRCPLARTRIKLVFGVGNCDAEVMFIGEGPGFDEDRKGEPFVGKAGQLLDRIMGAIGLDRSKVYIANIVKCHPMVDASTPDARGNDRPPNKEEIAACRPFLLEQVRIVKPKIIVTLGSTATQALLNRTDGITKLRGKFVSLSLVENGSSIDVLPTYHPAALLRDETLKKLVWEDMKLLRNTLTGGLAYKN